MSKIRNIKILGGLFLTIMLVLIGCGIDASNPNPVPPPPPKPPIGHTCDGEFNCGDPECEKEIEKPDCIGEELGTGAIGCGGTSIESYDKVYKALNGCIGFHEVNELNIWGDDVCGVYQDTIMDLWSDRGGHLHEYHENMFYMKAQPPFGNYYYDDLEGVMKGFFPCFTTAERVTAEEAALDRFAELCPGH